VTPRQKCPICGAPRVERWRPFCSKRCADVDLNRWLSGRYAIPVTEDDDEDGESAGPGAGAGEPEGPVDGRH
jgi:endogenous inhibitor of DNA gyrase (YacG/DUF329 family)